MKRTYISVRQIALSALVVFSLVVGVSVLTQSVYAATFTVTKTADTNDGSCAVADCSLREAITAAPTPTDTPTNTPVVTPPTPTDTPTNTPVVPTPTPTNTPTNTPTPTPVNSPPTATVSGGQCSASNKASGTINLTLNDSDGDTLTLTFVSNSNPTLVPNDKIVLGGSGNNRTLTVTAANKKSGTATLTFNLSDGTKTVPIVIRV